MRAVDVARAAVGTGFLVRPEFAVQAVAEPASPATDRTVRVLGGRLVVQALAGAAAARRPDGLRRLVAVDVAVELTHAVSMVGLAVLVPRRRRSALASAGLAGLFAAADVRGKPDEGSSALSP